MKNSQKPQMAGRSAICLPSANCRINKQKRPFLDKKQPENNLVENNSHLPSGKKFCHLDFADSEKPNKNKELVNNSRWQIPDGKGVLPSAGNPITTRPAAIFPECCADPLYLRYQKIIRTYVVNFLIRAKGISLGSGLGVVL